MFITNLIINRTIKAEIKTNKDAIKALRIKETTCRNNIARLNDSVRYYSSKEFMGCNDNVVRSLITEINVLMDYLNEILDEIEYKQNRIAQLQK